MNFTLDDIDIIYENDELIAINKPHGLLVHKTNIAADATEFALQLLRDKIGQKVFPAHRIDRKTSGVLLFTKSKQVLPELQKIFYDRTITKSYQAIVRGYLPEKSGSIDYDLDAGKGKKPATTAYSIVSTFEIDIPSSGFKSSRYSHVTAIPHQGRHHQIRKHFAHIFHPIIGDRPHGCNKQNRLWKERFNITTMMLHAGSLKFIFRDQEIIISAPLSLPFQHALSILRSMNLDL